MAVDSQLMNGKRHKIDFVRSPRWIESWCQKWRWTVEVDRYHIGPDPKQGRGKTVVLDRNPNHNHNVLNALQITFLLACRHRAAAHTPLRRLGVLGKLTKDVRRYTSYSCLTRVVLLLLQLFLSSHRQLQRNPGTSSFSRRILVLMLILGVVSKDQSGRSGYPDAPESYSNNKVLSCVICFPPHWALQARGLHGS